MAKGEISPRFVGKVDQDLAAARSNLVKHVADVRRMLGDGETTEVVFMHFAQTMLRETSAFHTALMFSAAVLTLTERETEDQVFPDAPWMYDFRIHACSFRAVTLIHRTCGETAGVISNATEPSFAHFGKLAELHLQGCQA